jgi:hypothetical protein
MDIIAITVCVNYYDILTHMLEQNSKMLHKWIIVTSPEDTNTINMIEHSGKENIKLLIYTDFYKNGAKFNFGGARLFAQNYIKENWTTANILFLDGDIYLPDNFSEKLPTSLEDDTLYGANRSDYWTVKDFQAEKISHTYKNAYFIGFFQLYKQDDRYMYADSFNCAKCDDVFRDKFPKKIKLDMCVKHLGRNGPNWNGRNYNDGIFKK